MSTADLGPFAEGVASWRRTMAATTDDEGRGKVLTNAAKEFAGYVTKGLDRVTAADRLHDMATGGGLTDIDRLQQIIAHGFKQIDVPPVIERLHAKHNGKAGKPVLGLAVNLEALQTMTFTPIKYVVPG